MRHLWLLVTATALARLGQSFSPPTGGAAAVAPRRGRRPAPPPAAPLSPAARRPLWAAATVLSMAEMDAADEIRWGLRDPPATSISEYPNGFDVEDGGEYRVDLAKPLGLSVEENMDPDYKGHVIVTRVASGGNAELAGVSLGDEITGVNSLFEDSVWRVEGQGVDKVQQLITNCERETVVIQLRRCAEAVMPMSDTEALLIDSDLDYVEQWKAVYDDAYPIEGEIESDETADADKYADTLKEWWDELPQPEPSNEPSGDKSRELLRGVPSLNKGEGSGAFAEARKWMEGQEGGSSRWN